MIIVFQNNRLSFYTLGSLVGYECFSFSLHVCHVLLVMLSQEHLVQPCHWKIWREIEPSRVIMPWVLALSCREGHYVISNLLMNFFWYFLRSISVLSSTVRLRNNWSHGHLFAEKFKPSLSKAKYQKKCLLTHLLIQSPLDSYLTKAVFLSLWLTHFLSVFTNWRAAFHFVTNWFLRLLPYHQSSQIQILFIICQSGKVLPCRCQVLSW